MRLGIFGGSFDPPHVGHLIVADDVAAELDLDRVVFVPTGIHPLKGSRVATPAATRLQMVRAAVGGSTRFVVDAREIERPGPSYTIDTVLELKGEHRGAELFLIVGADILGELQRWHRVEEIARHACFAVMSRAELAVPSALPSGLEMLEVAVTAIAVSSSDIRDRVRMGRPYRYLVPEAVREIIDGNSLYRNPGSVRNDIEK